MLASGAHIKLGNYEFYLDEAIDNQGGDTSSLFRPHYNHTYASVFASRQAELTGEVGKETVRPERLIWGMTDWSGGENQRSWNEEDPTVYDFSYGLHGRIKGQLQVRPNRTITTIATDSVSVRPAMCVANSAVWVGQSQRVSYSTDGTTWTQYTSANTGLNALDSGYKITAVAGDGERLYYTAWVSTASGTRIIMSATTSAAGTTVVSALTGVAPFAGLATLNGILYGWTGRKLIEHHVDQTFPLAAAYRGKVGDSGVDVASSNVFGTTWWAGCVAAESSIFCFYSQDGQSTVYEFQTDGGFGPIWSAPFGFTIKCMRYNNGILFMGGHEGGDSNAKGRGMMWAMPLDTRRPVFVAHFRKQNNKNLEMQEIAGSYGNTIMIAAARTGRVFIYDADMDSVSNLDMLNTGSATETESKDSSPYIANTDGLVFVDNKERIGDMITWGTKRIVCVYNPQSGASTLIQMVAYDDDEPANRQQGTSTASISNRLEVGDYDFRLPFDAKTLLGFDIIAGSLGTGQSIVVEYSIDDAAYVTAGTLTSASPGASTGRFYVAVSTPSSVINFSAMRYRLTSIGTNTHHAPIIKNVMVEAQLVTYEEVWQLIVRLKDEQDSYGNNRPSSRSVRGQTVRDWLWSVANLKAPVTLLDGYRYSGTKTDGTVGYTTNTIIIEQMEDIIVRPGEGSMKMLLRAVPS